MNKTPLCPENIEGIHDWTYTSRWRFLDPDKLIYLRTSSCILCGFIQKEKAIPAKFKIDKKVNKTK